MLKACRVCESSRNVEPSARPEAEGESGHSFLTLRPGVRSSCRSGGGSEGSASSPCWSPGPADPGPACAADAPADGHEGFTESAERQRQMKKKTTTKHTWTEQKRADESRVGSSAAGLRSLHC